MHDKVEEGQPSLEKVLSWPPMEISDEQDGTTKERPEVEGMDISQNQDDDGRKLCLGLVANGALTQGRKSHLWL